LIQTRPGARMTLFSNRFLSASISDDLGNVRDLGGQSTYRGARQS
jgi:hypothetical protein